MAELPTGTLTFLFTDIEGSTRLLHELAAQFGPTLERHQALIREATEKHHGLEVHTEGDSFFCVFNTGQYNLAIPLAAAKFTYKRANATLNDVIA